MLYAWDPQTKPIDNGSIYDFGWNNELGLSSEGLWDSSALEHLNGDPNSWDWQRPDTSQQRSPTSIQNYLHNEATARQVFGLLGNQGSSAGAPTQGSSGNSANSTQTNSLEPNYNLENMQTQNPIDRLMQPDSGAFNSLNVDRFATIPAATGGATTGGTATVGTSGGLWEALGGAKGALSGASGLAQGISGYLAAREQNRYNQGNQTGSESRMPYMNEFIRRIVPYLLQNQQSVFENRMREYGVPASSFSNITQLLSGINPNYNGI